MTFIETLQDYKERGLLTNQSHPTLPLLIWNYSVKVQYEQLWDEITLQCRALITDTDGNIVSRGFSKFFNIEEERHEATDDFEVFCKEDGQYIGVFWYNGEMVVNSKGSFTSPYAIEAKRILDEKYPEFERTTKNNPYNPTYVFELIGFEQIVVYYLEPDLISTGCFFKSKYEGWIDSDIYDILMRPFKDWPRLVKKYSGLDYRSIRQLNWKNSEGFVVRFSNGSRCKIKFEDYLKLHRQMTNLSTTGIWEALMNGEPVSSILNDVPDEFYQRVHQYETDLKEAFEELENEHIIAFNSLKYFIGFDRQEVEFHRRNFAYHAKKSKEGISPSILFAMLDGKDYSNQMWQLIKPKFEKI